VLHVNVDAPKGRCTFGVSGRLKSIRKHRILGVSSKGELCKLCIQRVDDLNDLYVV